MGVSVPEVTTISETSFSGEPDFFSESFRFAEKTGVPFQTKSRQLEEFAACWSQTIAALIVAPVGKKICSQEEMTRSDSRRNHREKQEGV